MVCRASPDLCPKLGTAHVLDGMTDKFSALIGPVPLYSVVPHCILAWPGGSRLADPPPSAPSTRRLLSGGLAGLRQSP